MFQTPVRANDENVAKLIDTRECYGCDLEGVDLTKAFLTNTVLRDSDLNGVNLNQARLYNTKLSGASISELEIANAQIVNTSFN